MRNRRGNYTLLFIFTSGILFSMIALSIDMARLRAASVSVQNAAEAGAIAALMEIRRGSSRARANLAADRAANFVSLTGLAAGGPQSLNLDIRWGEWLWERPRDVAWQETPNGRQGVSVNAKSSGAGIRTLFYPIAAALNGGEVANSGRFQVGSFARGALRNRDVVIAFDVSRMSRFTIDDMRETLRVGLEAIDEQRIPGDRISLVAYTGNSWIYDLQDPAGLVATANNVGNVADSITASEPALQNALVDASIVFNQAQQVVQRVQTCWMGPEVYHRLHRFFRPGLFDDQELQNQTIQYGFIEADQFLNAMPSVPWDDPNFASARLWLDQTTSLNQAQWDNLFNQGTGTGPGQGLDTIQQCQLWLMGLAHWLEMDPRVREGFQLGPDNSRSPLSCHAGAEIAVVGGDITANSYNNEFDVPEVFGCTGGLTFTDHTTGIEYPAWNFDDPVADDPGFGGVAGTDSRDIRFAWAGSNPGAGLRTAADILEARADRSREAVVYLLAGSEPECGPNLDQVASGFCPGPYVDDFAAAQQRLDLLGAHVYIAGNVDTGSQAGTIGDFLFSVGSTGRGIYQRVAEPAALTGTLLDFISDVQIQVVQ